MTTSSWAALLLLVGFCLSPNQVHVTATQQLVAPAPTAQPRKQDVILPLGASIESSGAQSAATIIHVAWGGFSSTDTQLQAVPDAIVPIGLVVGTNQSAVLRRLVLLNHGSDPIEFQVNIGCGGAKPSWLSASPLAGTIPAGQDIGSTDPQDLVNIDLAYNAAGLKQGIYNTQLCISTDEAGDPVTYVPVQLQVLCPALQASLGLTQAPRCGIQYTKMSQSTAGRFPTTSQDTYPAAHPVVYFEAIVDYGLPILSNTFQDRISINDGGAMVLSFAPYPPGSVCGQYMLKGLVPVSGSAATTTVSFSLPGNPTQAYGVSQAAPCTAPETTLAQFRRALQDSVRSAVPAPAPNPSAAAPLLSPVLAPLEGPVAATGPAPSQQPTELMPQPAPSPTEAPASATSPAPSQPASGLPLSPPQVSQAPTAQPVPTAYGPAPLAGAAAGCKLYAVDLTYSGSQGLVTSHPYATLVLACPAELQGLCEDCITVTGPAQPAAATVFAMQGNAGYYQILLAWALSTYQGPVQVSISCPLQDAQAMTLPPVPPLQFSVTSMVNIEPAMYSVSGPEAQSMHSL